MRTVIALVLIVLGVAGLAYGGISFTQRKNVVDLGAVQVDREERQTLPLPPIVGGVLLIAGVGVLLTGRHA